MRTGGADLLDPPSLLRALFESGPSLAAQSVRHGFGAIVCHTR